MQFRISTDKELQNIFQNSREFTDVSSWKAEYWPLEYSHHHKLALHIQKQENIPFFHYEWMIVCLDTFHEP